MESIVESMCFLKSKENAGINKYLFVYFCILTQFKMHVFIILFVCLAVSPKNKRVKLKTSSVLQFFNSSVRLFVSHTVIVKQHVCHDCQVNSQRVIHDIVRWCAS